MPVERHTHNGIDSEKLEPSEALDIPLQATVPTHQAQEGSMWIYDDQSSTRRLYIMVNGTWRYTALT